MGLIGRLVRDAILALVGRARGGPSAALEDESTSINYVLSKLFLTHGVASRDESGWLVFAGRRERVQAEVVRAFRPTERMATVQLDVRVALEDGRVMVESFAGIGVTKGRAIGDAVQNFAANSFHPILAAFFRAAGDDQVAVESWEVGGRGRRVVVGNVGVRGSPPVEGPALVSWFEHASRFIQANEIPPGTHWVRIYYAQMRHKLAELEVLLDNEDWPELKAGLASVDWPRGEAFFGLRVFLVIRDG